MFATLTHNAQRVIIGSIGTILAAGISLSGALAPAQAAETNTVRVQTVGYTDLNLNNAAGRAALEQRIKAAAESVCATGLNDTASRTAESRCVKAAVEAATAVTQG